VIDLIQVKKTRISTVIIFAVLLIIALTTLFPILFMFVNSFKWKIDYMKDPFGLPEKVIFDNYIVLFKQYGVLKCIFNSFFTTVTSIVLTAFISSLASFPFAKMRFKGKEALFMFISTFMMVPVAVLMIPTYVLYSKFGLVNNYLSIILFWFVLNLPYGIYMMTSNFRSIPTDTIESAKIDGASLFKIYYSIVLPMAKPILVTMIIVYFMWNWNDLLMPMVLLQSQEKTTLTVAVTMVIGKYVSNIPMLLAGLLINSIPTIAIYLIFQRYIIKGVTVGAIK